MKPYVICHMLASLDGGLHPSLYQEPRRQSIDWSSRYERVHQELKGDAWIVGRVTMAEMSKAGPHAPANAGTAIVLITLPLATLAAMPSHLIRRASSFFPSRHSRRSHRGIARAGRARQSPS